MDDRSLLYDFPIVLSFWWDEYPILDFLFYQDTILGCVDIKYCVLNTFKNCVIIHLMRKDSDLLVKTRKFCKHI